MSIVSVYVLVHRFSSMMLVRPPQTHTNAIEHTIKTKTSMTNVQNLGLCLHTYTSCPGDGWVCFVLWGEIHDKCLSPRED